MATETPARVCRFYGNTDFALELLSNKSVAFVRVSQLNDPFDPYAFFETDFGESRVNLIAYVERNHPDDTSWFKSFITRDSWKTTVVNIRNYMEKVKKTSLVLSTCAELPGVRPEQNLYMWGHYGNGHRGVAIEFDTEWLGKSVISHHADLGSRPLGEINPWIRVEYMDSFPPISAESVYGFMKQEWEVFNGIKTMREATQIEQYYASIGRVKSQVWKLENEWRLLWRNDETANPVYKIPLDARTVKKVFIGLAVDADTKSSIHRAVKANLPAASLLQAEKRPGDFALKFSRI